MDRCVLYERECINCGECDRCDLDPTKRCDNCMRCVNGDLEYRAVVINRVEGADGKHWHTQTDNPPQRPKQH